LLHVLATHLSMPMGSPETIITVQSTSGFGGLFARSFYGTFVTFLQFIIPAGLLFAALASFLKRSRAHALLIQAQLALEAAISSMSWGQFERLIGESFRCRGYEVIETAGGGRDGGVDLLLAKDGKSFLVQCKHWRTRSVGVTTLRELTGVIAARHAAGGFVITSVQFTPEATRFARSCGIELIDGGRLASLLSELELKPLHRGAPPPSGKTIATPLATEIDICPECGSAMTRRTAKRGQFTGQDFLGCTRYPTCRGVRQIVSRGDKL
jgi:restriction system protein